MLNFFSYNWTVRDEWIEWCSQLHHDELLQTRNGGVGSILQTLFHIIEVEYSWIRGIQGREDKVHYFEDYQTLGKVKKLSTDLRQEIREFLITYNEKNDVVVTVSWDENEYSKNEILHHIIAHEIHHIGQLSVWARELGRAPIQSNYIGRTFKY
ncbi:DinB family protein [Lysinibacillus cavernae]|uniref:DinB family protein n=1 Tax=Lysinibacillus cavernae TaxID=2666135 RepID=UPI0012DA0072|nr:DinB family protein [Lysinibacillus cavernae]